MSLPKLDHLRVTHQWEPNILIQTIKERSNYIGRMFIVSMVLWFLLMVPWLIGSLVQLFSGAHWFKCSLLRWFSHSLVQWVSGSLVQWF